jgi:hypothetical protein
MSSNIPSDSEAIISSSSSSSSSLFALPLLTVMEESEQGQDSSSTQKEKAARKKHNWKQMEHADELKTCMYLYYIIYSFIIQLIKYINLFIYNTIN